MKLAIISFGLFTLCLGATVVYEQGVPGGLILNQENLRSKSAWQSDWQSQAVPYPIVGEYPVNIGYIRVTNNLDSAYSTATKKSGGVGSKNVVFEFYAPAFRDYDYTVEIRAEPLVSVGVQL